MQAFPSSQVQSLAVKTQAPSTHASSVHPLPSLQIRAVPLAQEPLAQVSFTVQRSPSSWASLVDVFHGARPGARVAEVFHAGGIP